PLVLHDQIGEGLAVAPLRGGDELGVVRHGRTIRKGLRLGQTPAPFTLETCNEPSTTRQMGQDFDLVVIGSGPTGEKAAVKAAYFGKRAAVVERDRVLGGECRKAGLPSKVLRE